LFYFFFKRSIATRITKNNTNHQKSTCCLVAVNTNNIDDLCLKLLTNGNKLADDLNIKFITANAQFYNQSKKKNKTVYCFLKFFSLPRQVYF
jgi:uncharacterized protein YoxC